MFIGLVIFVLATFFVAGLASIIQASRNARTSTDSETGRWFVIGTVMAMLSLLAYWFFVRN